MKIHIVQPGETIESVAERYGISVEKLLEANDLSESDSLEAGMKVRIPTGRVPVAQQTPAAEPAGERPKHRPEPPKKETAQKRAQTAEKRVQAAEEGESVSESVSIALGVSRQEPLAGKSPVLDESLGDSPPLSLPVG